MKKIFTVLLTLFMVIMLGACSSKTDSPGNNEIYPDTVDEPFELTGVFYIEE